MTIDELLLLVRAGYTAQQISTFAAAPTEPAEPAAPAASAQPAEPAAPAEPMANALQQLNERFEMISGRLDEVLKQAQARNIRYDADNVRPQPDQREVLQGLLD